MTINTTTLEANLTTKINNTSGTTDGKEFLLLGKAVEAINTAISNNSLTVANNLSDLNNASTARTNLGVVASTGGTFTGDVDFGSNKITYANIYNNISDLPSDSTYHGMFAHVHATGKGYDADGGNWIPIVNEDTSGNVSLGGNLTVTADFTVNGTTTTINSTTMDVDDLNITVASGAANAAAADGAGLTVDGASATFNYANTGDKWTMNKPLDVTGSLTSSGLLTAAGADLTGGSINIKEIIEESLFSISTSGTITMSVLDSAVLYTQFAQTANRTINFRGDGSTTIDSMLGVGHSTTVTVIFNNGTTPYYLNAFQIDGTTVTPKWQGGSAPTAGNASSLDVYTFTILKTGSATYHLLASQTQFA